ncbi:MAG: hypothetical protein V4535_04870 [Bacteroidota bacterium]
MKTEDLIECIKYEGHEPGLSLIIYKDTINETFVKKCMYKDEIEFLKIGESTHSKKLNKLDIYFPLVFFDALEAKKYGLKIECNSKYKFNSYFNLTCDPENLITVENILFQEAIGHHLKIDIKKCLSCSTIWKVTEEYDSHHGNNIQCSIIEN